MNTQYKKLKEILDKAIADLKFRDNYLLKHNVNERSITHKLAEYLQKHLPEYFDEQYNVDCEYNRNIDKSSKKIKRLSLKLEEIIEESGVGIKSKIINNSEYYETSVYPDIIVHKRGENHNNLLIIEVKKSSANKDAYNYDCEKLKAYTDNSEGNSLKYFYGVLIEIETGNNCTVKCDKWFKNGEEM
jgi:hypothetical protein